MSYYRVQIEELNNGEKRYTPQVSTLSIVGKLFPKTNIRWENIVYDKNIDHYETAYTMRCIYDSYEEAKSVIENYKQWSSCENGTKVKTTTYEMIK
jgi:hypothetical protein